MCKELYIYKAVSNSKKKKNVNEKGWTNEHRNAESVKSVERNKEGKGKYRTASQSIVEQKYL